MFSSSQSWILLFHIYSTNSCAAFIPLVSRNRCSICTKSRVLSVGKHEESLLFQVGFFLCNLFFLILTTKLNVLRADRLTYPQLWLSWWGYHSDLYLPPTKNPHPCILANFSSPETSCQSWSADEVEATNLPVCHILSPPINPIELLWCWVQFVVGEQRRERLCMEFFGM